MITGRKAVARTSSTPGKTKLINHFLIEKEWYLVDLPGFGYARYSKSDREKWKIVIRNYLLRRKNLMCNFLLVDSRHEMQPIDHDWIKFHGENSLPFALVFTKSDKLSTSKLNNNLESYKNELRKEWEYLPLVFPTSSVKGLGRKELLEFIAQTNLKFSR